MFLRTKSIKALLVLVIALLVHGVAVAGEPATYGNGDTAFSVTLPAGWKFQSDDGGFAQFSGPGNSFFWVQRSKLKQVEPGDLIKWYTSKGYTLLYTRKPTSIAGIPAGRFILAKTDAKVEWRYDVTDAHSDTTQWVFFAVAPRASFKPELEKVYSSIYSSVRIPKPKEAVKPTVSPGNPPDAVTAPPAVDAVKEPAASTKVAEKAEVPVVVEAKPYSDTESKVVVEPAVKAAQPQSKGRMAFVRNGNVFIRNIASGDEKGYGKGSMPQLSRNGNELVLKDPSGKWKRVDLSKGSPSIDLPFTSKPDSVSVSPDGSLYAYTVVRKYLFGPNSHTVVVANAAGRVMHTLGGVKVGLEAIQAGSRNAIVLTAESCSTPSFGMDNETLYLSVRLSGTWGIASYNTRTGNCVLIASVGEEPKASLNGEYVAYARGVGELKEVWVSTSDGREHRRITAGVASFSWNTESTGLYVTGPSGGDTLLLGIKDGTVMGSFKDMDHVSVSN